MYALLSKNGFSVIEINFIGSAVYAIAQKASKTTFDQHTFNNYKKRFLRTFRLVKYFPKFPISIKGTNTSQLILQYLLAKNNNRTLKEVISLATFSIKNINYIKKEKGSRSKKASHVSYFSGWENAGDTVLSKCVRSLFNKSFSNGWNLIKLTDPVRGKNIEKINQSDYLLIGGGGVLLPDSNANSISGWQWAIDPTFWEKIKVPVIVFGIGYNFFKGQKNSGLFIDNLEKLVTRADFFSLRNHGSIKKVCELLPEKLHNKIAYQPCPTTIIRSLYPSLKSKKGSNLIGINIAFDRYERRFGKNIYTILDQIALAMKQIEELGFQIINVCHLENDSKFEISLDQRSVKYQTVNLQFMLPNEVYDFYNKVELMFGMRGHAQMIPFGLNTKIISLGTHDKIRYFLEDINALDWYIDVNQAPESLSLEMLGKFNQLMFVEKNETEKRLGEQQEVLTDVTQENMNKILKVVNNHKSQ
jgi:polysaccharide pyruvyl transferase WcaK-like protein